MLWLCYGLIEASQLSWISVSMNTSFGVEDIRIEEKIGQNQNMNC